MLCIRTTLMRIKIRLITLMRIRISIFIWCGSRCGSGFFFDSDPDPTFHPDANSVPDPDPSFQIEAKTLKCLNRLIFHTFWLVVRKLMRIRIRFRIQLITLMQIRILIFIWSGSRSGFFFVADANPDLDPGYQKWCGSMRIRIHNTEGRPRFFAVVGKKLSLTSHLT